jgi:hypothetical protein
MQGGVGMKVDDIVWAKGSAAGPVDDLSALQVSYCDIGSRMSTGTASCTLTMRQL